MSISIATLIDRLEPPKKHIRMLLDTDTYNEVDDQFALCYAACSTEKVTLLGACAAPFLNSNSTSAEDGMEKSYDEIIRLLGKMHHPTDGFVFRGARTFLPDEKTPVDSPAARRMIELALASPDDDPLYIVGIAAITNIASALLLEPKIADKIVIVWMGCHMPGYPTPKEFNLGEDIPAANVVFSSGAPVVVVPGMGVSSHMLTSIPEMEASIGGKNAVCDALVKLFAAYTDEPFGWAKEIWDVAAVAYGIDPSFTQSALEPSPYISPEGHWCRDPRRHPIRLVYGVNRNAIFRDMFRKLGNQA